MRERGSEGGVRERERERETETDRQTVCVCEREGGERRNDQGREFSDRMRGLNKCANLAKKLLTHQNSCNLDPPNIHSQCLHARTYARTYARTHARTHACTHTHTHTHHIFGIL